MGVSVDSYTQINFNSKKSNFLLKPLLQINSLQN
jgi:hypothetical protein